MKKSIHSTATRVVYALLLLGLTAVTTVDARTIRFDHANDKAAISGPFTLLNKAAGHAELASAIVACQLDAIRMGDDALYERLTIPGLDQEPEPGSPALPLAQALIRIPDGSHPELTIDQVVWQEADALHPVAPVQEPIPDVMGGALKANAFAKNQQAYNRAGFNKQPPVRIADRIRARGKEYICVVYAPVQFDLQKLKLRFAVKVRWHLRYKASAQAPALKRGDAVDAPTNALDIRLDTDASAVKSGDTLPDVAGSAADADYLVLTPDQFHDQILPLAAWKHRKGYRTYVAKLSEVGSTDTAIKQYISEAYNNGRQTAYVLLIGDCDKMPGFEIIGHPYHGSNHVWHSDYPYSCVDGDDNYGDLAIGRLSADNAGQLTTMIDKILVYEKTPATGNWYKHVLLAGQFQDSSHDGTADRWFMEDLHRIGDFLGPDYNYFSGNGDAYNKGFTIHTAFKWDTSVSETLHYRSYGYTGRLTPPDPVPQAWKNFGGGGASQIKTAIENGVCLALHRDHGYGSGAGWGHPGYKTSDVNALNNGDKLPVVISLNCVSGRYDDKDAFAEAWLRKVGGGGIAHIGAARVSYSGINDCFHVGLMDGLFDDYDAAYEVGTFPHSSRPGEFLVYGKHYLITRYRSSYSTMTANMFNLLGDPELPMRTANPQTLSAVHPTSLNTGSQSVTIRAKIGSANCAGARITLVKDGSVYATKLTAGNGTAAFTIAPAGSGVVLLTVSKNNCKPYLAEITINGSANNPPTAHNKNVTMAEDTAKSITLSGSDPDGDTLTFHVLTQPSHGSLSGTAPALTYTPNANYNGADTFTYRVRDGQANSAAATVSINVTPVNDRPIARFSASPQNGQAPLAVAFNAGTSSDVDGDPLTYAWNFGDGTTGSGQIANHTYTRAGTFTARLTVSDGSINASATKQIAVEPASGNQAPVVAITSPATGANIKPSQGFSVQADASDDSAVDRVEFFRNNTLIFTDRATPYKSWQGVLAAGTYTFKAKAWDDQGLSTMSAPITVTVLQPQTDNVVSLVVLDSDINEADPQNRGSFRIERTGTTTQPLDVQLGIWGLARNATDYKQIARTVTIPANKTKIWINVVALPDDLVEGDEEMYVRVNANEAYTLGDQTRGTLVIRETFFAWNRKRDWTPGTVEDETDGNPSPDIYGNEEVWRNERLNPTASPWYKGSRKLLVWDPVWYSQGPEHWGAGDNITPAVFKGYLKWRDREQSAEVPAMSWFNRIGGQTKVDITGSIRLHWGENKQGHIEVALVRIWGWDEIFTRSVSVTSNAKNITIPLDIREVAVNNGQRLLLTCRPSGAFDLNLYDNNLHIRETQPAAALYESALADAEGQAASSADMVVHARNSQGLAVGYLMVEQAPRAFVGDPQGDYTLIPTLGGACNFAFGLNEIAWTVGASARADGSLAAFLYDGENVAAIPAPGWSFGLGVNNAGDVVGAMQDAATGEKPFIYRNGRIHELPGWNVSCPGRANAINNRGDAVGWIQRADGSISAVLWPNLGVPQELTDDQGSALIEATAIDDNGVVTVRGADANLRQLTPMTIEPPIPPETEVISDTPPDWLDLSAPAEEEAQ